MIWPSRNAAPSARTARRISPGHNQAGSKMARSILLRLKAPTYLVESASALVAIHDGAPAQR